MDEGDGWSEADMKVAVIGGGVSGLVAAHALRDRCDVVLLEAGARPGGHANTVTVPTRRGTTAVDTGFIVLNDRNYPRLEALLADLGVATQPSDMSFGVSDEAGDFEYASTSLSGLFAVRRHAVSPRFWRMVLDVPRFQRAGRALLAGDEDPSLRAWLAGLGVSGDFVERVVVPQAAAVWSADPEQLWTFPARFLVRFFANHGMLGLTGRPAWRTVTGGSRTYVDAIAARLGDRLRCDAPVAVVRRTPDGVEVTVAGEAPERFDEVVLACHADQALALLADASPAERALLGAFPSQPNEVVLHTDTSVMPRRRAAWASWNAHLLDDPTGLPTLTYDLTRLQSLDCEERLLVTMNHTGRIDPARVLSRHAYAHPVFTPEGTRAQERHGEVSGSDRVHFAGAYWGWGFHEDGVVSGERAAAAVAAVAARAEPAAA